MGVLHEVAAQFRYQKKMAALLGSWDALRFRAAMLGARFGLHDGKLLRLKPRSLAFPVDLRIASTDANVYGQVVLRSEYAAVAVGSPRTIVDCGANVGYTGAFFLSRFPEAQVIAIEPFPANAEMCRRNLAPYGSRARVIEAAVWSSSCRLVVQSDGGNEWGIRVRPAERGEAGDVDAIDIASLRLERIDILKIDIEGSEAELFGVGAESWLPGVASIAIELHGPACEGAFRAAIAPYVFDETTSGELTICLNMRLANCCKPIETGGTVPAGRLVAPSSRDALSASPFG